MGEVSVDTTKHYKCYYCEEEIEFAANEPVDAKYIAFLKKEGLSYENEVANKPYWRHVSTKAAMCQTSATPTNQVVPSYNDLKTAEEDS